MATEIKNRVEYDPQLQNVIDQVPLVNSCGKFKPANIEE